MPEILISGIPVHFPYEPYKVQRDYMEKVITCLRDGTNGVLESPTGTGKTLSLLCSSLAWLLSRKQAIETQTQTSAAKNKFSGMSLENSEAINHMGAKSSWGLPKIIYASRTHSQLTQAMNELKRTAYSFMRSVVLGSRDQLCIHPEVMREQNNANKVQMCKLRVQAHQCTFYLRVESRKDDPNFRGPTIMDIEDLVKVGQQLRMCPYYASKELVGEADITFMPYNYLLDPIARKANKIELANTIVILDEAHNIEKICEEAASVQIKSSDVAMCIENITHIMKGLTSTSTDDTQASGDEPRDFTIDDLALLKEMLLELEKAIDGIVVENKIEGATYPAAYIFEMLGKLNIHSGSSRAVIALLDKLVQFLAVESQNSIIRKGGCFQKLQDFLLIVFANKEDVIHKVYKSFKVHVQIEESPQSTNSTAKDGWFTKSSNKTTTQLKTAKVINYWCFNPGFGMEQLLNTNVRSIILTSGTLAPLNPLIAELSLPVAQRLENPHIVSASQVYVKIIGTGPDREQLISNFQNRDNPKYINSLGSTVLNVARVVPDGLLVFFPSYPLLNQCANCWQACGLWADITRFKPIFVEPRGKEDFNNIMENFYQSIKNSKGACFLAVCRGKVSEGLDFADRNGRAVIITGLPYPPLKDPKVILKKKYLEDNRTKENELLSGQEWYSLDATRAVNQAIGRVIRHRDDYGAILLCDVRFQYNSQVQQLSKWIRDILGNQPKSSPFGPIVKELRDFFRNAEKTMVKPKERVVEKLSNELSNTNHSKVNHKNFSNPKEFLAENFGKVENTNSVESWTPRDYAKATGLPCSSQLPNAMDFMSRLNGNVTAIDFNCLDSPSSSKGNKDNSTMQSVKIHKRERSAMESTSPTTPLSNVKKRKYKIVERASSTLSESGAKSEYFNDRNKTSDKDKQAPEERMEFLKILRAALNPTDFSAFSAALISYKNDNDINTLMDLLFKLLGKPDLLYMLRGMRRFLKINHRLLFDKRLSDVSSQASINPL